MRKLSGFSEYVVYLIGYCVLILLLAGAVVLIGGTAAWTRIADALAWVLTPIRVLPMPLGAIALIVGWFTVVYGACRKVCRLDAEAAGILTGVVTSIVIVVAGIVGG